METATAPSFTARRPAATTLPTFTLPPPNTDIPSMQKYPHPFAPASSSSSQSHHPVPPPPLANVLTPPSGVTSDGLSPLSSSVNSGSSQSSNHAGMYSYVHANHGGWPTSGNSSYTYSSAGQGGGQALAQPQYQARSAMYHQPSPGMPYSSRSSQSPATGGEGLPPPPYDQVHQPFQTSLSGGGGSSHSSLPSQAPPPQNSILSSQNPVSSQPPTPSSAPAHVDSYSHSRPPPTQGYYTPSSTPQQSSFPSYAHAQPSPTQPSPTTSAGQSRGLASIAGQPSGGMAPPAPYRAPYSQQPLGQYGHVSMGGPIMSNITNPNGQMSLVPGMNVPHGYSHHMPPHMYGHGQQQQQTERPFKCDQCVQSFNRNHDLKRHKRIHLAVKPFPCTFCEKSFSRKDALKRHRLVKGCGDKASGADSNGAQGNGASPPERSDVMSDGTEGSPKMKGEKA